MQAIVVLNDGETWTDAEGCSIVIVTEAQMDALMGGETPKDLGLTPPVEIGLKVYEGREMHGLEVHR